MYHPFFNRQASHTTGSLGDWDAGLARQAPGLQQSSKSRALISPRRAARGRTWRASDGSRAPSSPWLPSGRRSRRTMSRRPYGVRPNHQPRSRTYWRTLSGGGAYASPCRCFFSGRGLSRVMRAPRRRHVARRHSSLVVSFGLVSALATRLEPDRGCRHVGSARPFRSERRVT